MSGILDFLCVGAHADDVELGMGGTVAKMASLGRRGAILDVTDASAGTRGTSEERLREAAEAARILGVERYNLGFRDGHLDHRDESSRKSFGEFLRRHRPRVVFTHPTRDRHPDHEQVAALVREMAFLAGLAKFELEGDPFRPARVFHWMGARDGQPDFCVDVSEQWAARNRAIDAYASQFGPGGPQTPISGAAFREVLEARGRHLGSRIRAVHAEGFFCEELPEVADPCGLADRVF